METKFKAREGSYISDQDANRYGMELYRLVSRNGAVTPKLIVEDAKNPKTAYHGYFEWDNKKCGEKWREQQARVLIDSIQEVVFNGTGKPISVRSFLNVDIDGQNVYVPQKAVFERVDLSKQIVDDALRELRGWRARYEAYAELSELCKKVSLLADKFTKTK